MTQSEMIWIAKKAVEEHMDIEDLYYSDYMYGQEELIEDVWEYVEECYEIGTKAFNEKYPD